jgi:hypothetical protein
MKTFCTIITSSHLALAKVLSVSLRKHFPDYSFHVLVADEKKPSATNDLSFISLSELSVSPFFKEIEKKYAHTNADQFRWALKPVLIGHLLEKGFSKVIFTDPDTYFVGTADVDQLLDQYAVLLTPHWADTDIVNNPDSVLSVMKGGLFNAGFIASSQKALPAMQWWAGMCHYKMDKREDLGVYDDQKYLDLLPAQFEGVHILKHQGMNLASWNIQTCKRELVDGRLLINKKYEPVFIHFAKDTIINILNLNDVLLKPYLDEYVHLLSQNGFELLKNLEALPSSRYQSVTYKIKHKLRLRTRIKRFFYKLAEKL